MSEFTVLQAQAENQECAKCGSGLTVIHSEKEGWHIHCPRCRSKSGFIKPDEKRRIWNMAQQELAKREQSAVPALRMEDVQQFIAPKATQAEAYVFLRFCQAQGLNPFARDAYLLKYDASAPASIVIGIQAFIKRAARHPAYAGYQSGIIVRREGAVQELPGSFLLDDDILLGGWATIRRTDWAEPTKITVSFKEYNKHQALWKDKPATMIEKVALAQGLRRVFPEDVGVLYEQGVAVEVAEPEDMPMASSPAPAAPQKGGPDWCEKHQRAWFQTPKMKNPAHPIGDGTGGWCNKPKPSPATQQRLEDEPHPAEEEL